MPAFTDALGAARSLASGMLDPSSLLASFASAFDQHTRWLKLHVASSSGVPNGTLLPHRLMGHEAINEGFRFKLEVLSNDTHLELKTLLGVAVQVSVLTDAGDERDICGLVTEARQEGSDGGFATYRLVIEDGLSVLRLARSARVAMDVNVVDLTERILRAHLDANPALAGAFSVDNRCQGDYPERPFWLQFNETDVDYLRRIWAREGISFVMAPSENSTPEHPQHSLILFDDPMDLDQNTAGRVRFHRADSSEASDAITEWNGRRVLQSGSLSISAWDPTSASVSLATEASRARQGGGDGLASSLEDYRHEASLEGESAEAIATSAARRMQAREGWAKRFDGSGTVRTFAAGTWFSLIEHPVHDHGAPKDREFVLANVDMEALNNLPKDLATGLSGLLSQGKFKAAETYRNRFECVRRGTPILAEEIDPADPGILTATVAGPAGETVHTDAMGRIKVTFHFARPSDHPEAGATGTDADSAWLRQLETWSSQGFGGNFIPRVGDEVLVQFLGGDPDRPLITGSAPNSIKIPASFSGVSGLPGEKALTGIRSQMHGGAGGNELMLDDSTNELRTQLGSDHAASRLQLGYLVQPRSGGASAPRGEGFELRTDAWGALRGGQGLLISTDTAAGPHLDAGALTAQVDAGLALSKALSDVSEQHGADKLGANEAMKALKEHAEATKKLGSGQAAQDVTAFKTPLLGLSSPAGIVSATPASQVISAGEHLHLTSGEDTNLGVGGNLVMAIKESWSVFVAKSGMKLYAGKANVDIQAHEGAIQIAADKDAKIISANGALSVLGKDYVRLNGGGVQIELTASDVNLTMSGKLNVKGKMERKAAGSASAEFPELPKGSSDTGFSERVVLANHVNGKPLKNVPYEIVSVVDHSLIAKGQTDDQGRTERWKTGDKAKSCVVWIGDGEWTISHDHDYASFASEEEAWPRGDDDSEADADTASDHGQHV